MRPRLLLHESTIKNQYQWWICGKIFNLSRDLCFHVKKKQDLRSWRIIIESHPTNVYCNPFIAIIGRLRWHFGINKWENWEFFPSGFPIQLRDFENDTSYIIFSSWRKASEVSPMFCLKCRMQHTHIARTKTLVGLIVFLVCCFNSEWVDFQYHFGFPEKEFPTWFCNRQTQNLVPLGMRGLNSCYYNKYIIRGWGDMM